MSMLAALALSTSIVRHGGRVPALAAAASDRACDRSFAAAIRDGNAAAVPGGCWRIGPIALGMNEAEVERRLGAPVARRADATGAITLHVFPLRPGALVVAGRARFRMAELRYAGGRLVAIDDDVGARIDTDRCASRPGQVTADGIEVSARAGPMIGFAGATIGEPVASLRRRFGRAPSSNRSHDWYTYPPLPLSFGADDRGRIGGFAIGRDEEAFFAQRPLPELRLRGDPTTCRVVGIDFSLDG